MNALKHIKHFNSLDGKRVTKAALQLLLNSLHADIKAGRIDAHMPYGVECIDIKNRLEKAIKQMNGKIQVIEKLNVKRIPIRQNRAIEVVNTSHGPVAKVKAKPKPEPKPKVKPKPKPPVPKAEKPKPKPALEGFKRVDLDGNYKDFVKLYQDTQIMYFGLPGSGKTWDLLTFAKYLADKGLEVVYISAEEAGRSTFDEKVQEIFNQPSLKMFKYNHLVIVKSFDELKAKGHKVEDFDVIFFDSVDKMKMTVDDWTDFCNKHPEMIKIGIKQTTKEGNFKGGQDWSHEMDIVVEIRNRRRIFHKNRLDKDFAEKRDKLLFDDELTQREKRYTINQKVRDKLKPPPPEKEPEPLIFKV